MGSPGHLQEVLPRVACRPGTAGCSAGLCHRSNFQSMQVRERGMVPRSKSTDPGGPLIFWQKTSKDTQLLN